MKKILIIVALIFLIFPFLISYAQCDPNQAAIEGKVCLDDPLGGASPQVLIGRVINAVLGIVGSLALAIFIYGGFMWMTAAGNKERVEKGKNVLVWASIGLVIIFSSYAMVRLVFKGLGIE